jgi:large subunit ribosomal protein L10
LRGHLVVLLLCFGGGITNTLESGGRRLYFTVEGRRGMLEDEEKGTLGEAVKEEKAE